MNEIKCQAIPFEVMGNNIIKLKAKQMRLLESSLKVSSKRISGRTFSLCFCSLARCVYLAVDAKLTFLTT